VTVHTEVGDCIAGKRLVYEARKAPPPSLFMKGGAHRGLRGKLHDARCWVETPIQKS